MIIKNLIKSKGFYIFLIGCLFGICLIRTKTGSPSPATWLPDNELIKEALLLPGKYGYFIIGGAVLTAICLVDQKIFKANLCRGLAFDGGPLEWVEWASVYISMAVVYGLLTFVIYKLYKLVYKKFMSRIN